MTMERSFPCDILAKICISLILTHALTIFYASSFQWEDLIQRLDWNSLITHYYTRNVIVAKAIACFLCILCSVLGQLSTLHGSVLTILFAIPQLYRSQSSFGQRVRVALGPLAPILAFNNLDWQNPWTVTSATISFLAFVVFRPDNTAVLQCFGLLGTSIDVKHRRRIHGMLATCNTLVAVLIIVVHFLQ